MRSSSIYITGVLACALGITGCSDDPAATPDMGTAPTDMNTGPTGFDFRTDPVSAFTRVDRVGMPAVSTVLATNKAAYNDGDPTDDVALTFAGELIANLQGLHDALDDDLNGVPVVPCSMGPSVPGDTSSLPICLAQEVAPGVSVVSLVVPDTITLDTAAASGFPNGRLLTDPVIDVTLAVILLDLTATGQTAVSLVGTNPTANDVAFSDTFPYLAAAH